MFCDEAKIQATAGSGGNGCVSTRKEKFIPYGGPDGGDGGKGGDVILVADENHTTLSEFRTKKRFAAPNGGRGDKKKMHGKNGESMRLKVPCGTLVYNEDKSALLADLTDHGQEFRIVRGGRGGFGNAHFTSSTRRRPMFAEKGEPGETLEVVLELKMIAEVGIIGFPSAGKSTLISKISNAKPKVAAYHFTTLIPNLGVVDVHKFHKGATDNFLVADIPGLIEGASEGKGIGDTFLKHIQRTRLLVHVIDGSENNLADRYHIIQKELKKFDECLAKKPQIVVLNKLDMCPPELQQDLIDELKKEIKVDRIIGISAIASMNLKELVSAMWDEVKKLREAPEDESQEKPLVPVIQPLNENEKHITINETFRTAIKDEKEIEERVFVVSGKRLNQIAKMTDELNEEALARFYDVLGKMGVLKRIQKMGAEEGDIIICEQIETVYLNIATLRG